MQSDFDMNARSPHILRENHFKAWFGDAVRLADWIVEITYGPKRAQHEGA